MDGYKPVGELHLFSWTVGMTGEVKSLYLNLVKSNVKQHKILYFIIVTELKICFKLIKLCCVFQLLFD